MEYKLQISFVWEFGRRVDEQGNPHQEDEMFPKHRESTPESRLFILCDGMGGHEAGEVASATVCEAMRRSIQKACQSQPDTFSDDMVNQAVADAFKALDKVATELGKSPDENKKMGTTMTMLKFHSEGATIAHMGDSRVYHIRPGKTMQDTQVLWHTEDHSLVNDLVKSGEITPEQAKTSAVKNVITRALQPFCEKPSKADIYHISDIRKGDYFYMCSDGMIENMEDHQLCFFFSQAVEDSEKANMLVRATNENRDNHSAIIVKVEEVGETVQEEDEKPRAGRSRKVWLIAIPILLIVLAGAACFFLYKRSSATGSEDLMQKITTLIQEFKKNNQ